MIAIPNMEKPKKVDGISIAFHFEDGHIESHIIGIEEIIDIVTCGECKHRDPEDKKCDCGMFERQGCIFPVDDDYFCKYGERANNTRTDE